jgi:hypothetical protein
LCRVHDPGSIVDTGLQVVFADLARLRSVVRACSVSAILRIMAKSSITSAVPTSSIPISSSYASPLSISSVILGGSQNIAHLLRFALGEEGDIVVGEAMEHCHGMN